MYWLYMSSLSHKFCCRCKDQIKKLRVIPYRKLLTYFSTSLNKQNIVIVKVWRPCIVSAVKYRSTNASRSVEVKLHVFLDNRTSEKYTFSQIKYLACFSLTEDTRLRMYSVTEGRI